MLDPSADDAASADPADARCSPEMGLFWAVHPDHQGKGYATEAARVLIAAMFKRNLKRFVATTEFDNKAAQAVMRKLGMTLLRNICFPQLPWCQVVGVLANPA